MPDSPSQRSNLSIRWQFLPWGYRAQYDFEAVPAEGSVKKVAETLVRSILPEECRSHDTVTDLRGRDPQQPLLLSDGGGSRPAYEELFFLAGDRKADSEESDAPDDGDSRIPFETTLYTKFLKFEGASHIVHSVSKLHYGFEDTKPNLLELAIDPDVTISNARLGLELFQSRNLVLFGLSPSVRETLTVECSASKLALRIASEGLSNRRTLPLKARGLFGKLSQALKALFEFDLDADYRNRLG